MLFLKAYCLKKFLVQCSDAVIASFIALIMTIFFEWIKVVKAYIIVRRRQSPLTYGKYHKTDQYQQQQGDQGNRDGDGREVQGSYSSTAELLSSLKIPASIEQIRKWRLVGFSCFFFFFFFFFLCLRFVFPMWRKVMCIFKCSCSK